MSARNQKSSVSNRFQVEVSILFRLVDVLNHVFIYLHSVFKGVNPPYVISLNRKKNKNPLTLAYTQTFIYPVSFKLGSMIETTKLCILRSL